MNFHVPRSLTQWDKNKCEPILTPEVESWLMEQEIKFIPWALRWGFGKELNLEIPEPTAALLFKLTWM
jgi:hypothetical protein